MSKTFVLAEAAALLNCHPETLRRAVRKGSLQAARLGRGYRFSRSDLQTFWTAQGGGQLFPAASEDDGSAADNASGSAETRTVKKQQIPGLKQLSLMMQGQSNEIS